MSTQAQFSEVAFAKVEQTPRGTWRSIIRTTTYVGAQGHHRRDQAVAYVIRVCNRLGVQPPPGFE